MQPPLLQTMEVQFSAVIEKDNWMAVQFHPEKSGAVGLKILENFMKVPDADAPNHCLSRCFCRACGEGRSVRRPDRRGRSGRTWQCAMPPEAQMKLSFWTSLRPTKNARFCWTPCEGRPIRSSFRSRLAEASDHSKMPCWCSMLGPTRSALTPRRWRRPELITEIGSRFGEQAVVVAIDGRAKFRQPGNAQKSMSVAEAKRRDWAC